jgi:hypothetical protein
VKKKVIIVISLFHYRIKLNHPLNSLDAPNNLVNPSLTTLVSDRAPDNTASLVIESDNNSMSDIVRVDPTDRCKDSQTLTVSVSDLINPKTLTRG